MEVRDWGLGARGWVSDQIAVMVRDTEDIHRESIHRKSKHVRG